MPSDFRKKTFNVKSEFMIFIIILFFDRGVAQED